MGKGLGLSTKSKGTYVAFAAGTGILVYIDLVVRLILSKKQTVAAEHRLSDDFKLVLYVSFAS